MVRKKIIFGTFFVCVLFLLGTIFFRTISSTGIKNNNNNIITSFVYNNIKFGGDFTLNKHDGTEFKFSDVAGKPSLLYFGFTHCPDFCPTSLQIMDAVSNKIDINRIFISVDPQRDTIKNLSDYVSLYKAGLIGLTGTASDIDTITKQWNVYYSLNKQSETDENYVVDHTTYLYITDKTGKPIAMVRPEATPKEIIKFLKKNGF
jgi:protein SCO1/2